MFGHDTRSAEIGEVLRVLLIEDDPDDVYTIRRALKTVTIPVKLTHVEDGRVALDMLQAEGGDRLFDMVLLDLNMPVVDGWTVLRTLRADPRFSSLPIMVLTTLREPDVLAEARRLGANAAMSKGTTFEATCDIAQSVVDLWTGAVFVDAA
jgi:CheY-like chemotaxis protein